MRNERKWNNRKMRECFSALILNGGGGGEKGPNETSENERPGIGQKPMPRSPKWHGDMETREGGREGGWEEVWAQGYDDREERRGRGRE